MADHAPSRSRAQTLRPIAAPVVLVVGGPDALFEVTRRVVERESPVIHLHQCEPAAAATAAASERPFAIVLSQDIFAFDPAEFEALARDVGAVIVSLEIAAAPRTVIEQELRPQLRTAFRNWRASSQSGMVSTK